MKALANEKVVYILGAGFSAQFGLPVMSNFLEKSKDMYTLRRSKFFKGNDIEFFGSVYDEIDKLRRCKDFYTSDMTNIEEILSLFEMGKMLGKDSKQQINFQNFIAEVIKYHTPTINRTIRDDNNFKSLCSFILHLFGRNDSEDYNADMTSPEYSILTFNYDSLLEDTLENCRTMEQGVYSYLKFATPDKQQNRDKVPYIKLHGDIAKPETIVTPTWKKAFEDSKASTWIKAGSLLEEANHIRIIGYSLPITDSYLKYFLKWGAAQAQHLKSIDVICIDDEQHSVESRYRDFIHHKLNFYNNSTGDYLAEVREGIEDAHQNLFYNPQRSRTTFSFK